jgi:hypothetical protein
MARTQPNPAQTSNPRIVVMSGAEYLSVTSTGQVDWTMNPRRAIEYSEMGTAIHDAARFDGCAVRERWTSNGGKLQTFYPHQEGAAR